VAPGFHLAQLNVARFKAPPGDPVLDDFMAALDPINAIADAAPGFVWRLQTDEGNATSIHAFEDDLMLVNMSVWDSVELLAEYVYSSPHLDIMRRRREWTVRLPEQHICLWWISVGAIPTVEEAIERLEHLRANGPTPYAFTFKKRFSPGETAVASPGEEDRWFCPA
jgi:hypothetical protein